MTISAVRSNKKEFFDILHNNRLVMFYQPIISLKDGEILGYEALARGPENSVFYYPCNLFDIAKKMNKVWELDVLCRLSAIKGAKDVIEDKYLFINVDSNIIKDPDFKKGFTKELLGNYSIEPRRIIFEITEHTVIDNYKGFREILENYRSQGYRIAIDDAGEGYSGLRTLSEIRPNYIKLDMGLIREIDKDMVKKELIKSFQRFADITGIKLIAEGIETYNELKTLIEIGIEYGQGYYIQKPSPDFKPINPNTINDIQGLRKKEGQACKGEIKTSELVRQDNALELNLKCIEIHNLFSSNQLLQGVTIVSGERIVGLVMRNKFYFKMAAHKDNEAFVSLPIYAIMDNAPLIVDENMPLMKLCKMIVLREEEKIYDYAIVTKAGKYTGVIPVAHILEKLANIDM
ncbi:EAL domain-containing protein [Alkaliphilus pronyensis]|uniref:EAL domain-containing protein n=1 Tax=Alkaliphilus pronyensis TaxID=1482732 RepID=A0A6I0EYA8_9FIRM|nr:EAL domain-containing protein [Alkaliphilus pronyensis]KAB3529790.1 EAL domain-containing protein [Alkaliphilus pronyensis]